LKLKLLWIELLELFLGVWLAGHKSRHW
jgi:hypothetical protein